MHEVILSKFIVACMSSFPLALYFEALDRKTFRCLSYYETKKSGDIMHGSLPQPPKSEQLDKLKMFRTMLERLISVLQFLQGINGQHSRPSYLKRHRVFP
ncbi:hypothetical protein L3X38_031522 [Prunus dulcis]|uniref:Uncharacterized protein n=1 Tax=Prunus dulcis TaxID=3755 RepID=A0AAD4YV02_PRUDU|nr:hypothetical protein L3X38_031522 [Prunus dulcis]